MSQNTVKLGKHTFVGGLTWVALSRPRELKKEALQSIRKFEGDCYVLRQGVGTAQVGIGSAKEGAAAKQISFAAAIATAVGTRDNLLPGKSTRLNDWLGVFELPGDDCYAFVAVRDGAILPTGDFIGSFDEAVERLEHNYGVGGWAAIFGSERVGTVGYHNFVQISTDDLLGLKNGSLAKASTYAVRSVKANLKPTMLIGGVLAAVIVAVAGWKVYERERAAAEFARVQAELAALQGAPQTTRLVEYEQRWIVQPGPADFLNACVENHTNQAPGGWRLMSYACDAAQSEAVFNRNGSTVRLLKAAIGDVDIDNTGSTAMLRRALRHMEHRSEDLLLWEPIRIGMMAEMQAMGIQFNFGEARMPDPPAILPEEQNRVELVPPFWREHRFSIGPTPIAPRSLVGVIERPGVRINKVVFQDQNWTYEGIIYAK